MEVVIRLGQDRAAVPAFGHLGKLTQNLIGLRHQAAAAAPDVAQAAKFARFCHAVVDMSDRFRLLPLGQSCQA